MIPNPLLERWALHGRNDRASNELRAYARAEWRAGPAWVQAMAGPSFLARLRRRMRGTSRDRSRHRPASAPAAEVESVPVYLVDPEDCTHTALADLGTGGTADFLRCSECGNVLIVQDGRCWHLDPADAPRRDDLLRV